MTDGNETELDESTEQQVDEQEQVEGQVEGQEAEAPAEESDEVVVTIGDEPAPEEVQQERAPEWVRELRERNKETVKENRELKKRLEALQAAPGEQAVQLGEKPTLESCEYDTDKFEAELVQWHERKREHAEQERKKQEAGVKAQQELQEKINAYAKAKETLKVSDMADAEASAFDVLNFTQRGVILDAVDNPALVIYALGKNQKKAQELAAITNPIKFAVAVSKLEKDMKVTPKKSAPLPESTVRGNARMSGGSDETLERLREKARQTGDMSPVIAYKAQLKAKARG